MRVQTKITLLLGVVVTAFVGALFAFRAYDHFKFHQVALARMGERQRSLDQFLVHHGAPLRALVEDYTSWDQMVQAVSTQDWQWFGQNINRSTLDSFHAHAVWIFGMDGKLLYPLSYPDFAELPDYPIKPELVKDVFGKGALVHFFLKSPYGVMEIRGGTIHSSRDFKRATPQGYFFAGRVWNQPTLDEMAIFTGDNLRVAPVSDPLRFQATDERNGTVSFVRPLKGWNGEPVAQLIVRNESPIVHELNRESDVILCSLIVFALLLLLLISFSLSRSVRKPLAIIMRSLTRNDPRPIETMARDSSEFGALARTIRTFFVQRDDLIREIEERRGTEEELRKKGEELRHSQKMEAVGRLAGGIAHDFNNLLTAIIGYAELIGYRSQGDPVVQQNAELIGKAGDQAANLTRQLLAFSRKQILQPRVLDLNSLVVDMENLLRRVIGERFKVLTKPEATDGRVRADPSQLEQVLLNLGVNARDAMPHGGTVTIRTSNEIVEPAESAQMGPAFHPGSYVVLSVSDTGVGMDAQTMAQIFEPFFTTKAPGKGTGLGLAMVYGIVQQSGGGLAVESKVARGSTFRVYLPLEDAPLAQIKAPARPVMSTSNSETIFVVEDDPIVRQLVCDVLAESGYHVLCAADGHEAIRMSNRHPGDVHLLVTDVVMPQITGPQLARTLCQSRPEMKVLYVSGYSVNDMGEQGVLGENIELLQKPFSPHALLSRIREVLGNAAEWSMDSETADASQLKFAI